MLSLISLLIVFASAETYTGDVFDLEGKTKHFTYESSRETQGDTMTYTAVFKDLEGNIAAQEKATVKNGVIERYEASRPPVEDSGVVETSDGKIRFSYTEKKKTTKSKDNLKPDTLFSGTLVPHIQANFDKLLAKEELPFRYVVWYRKETIGFKFTLDSESNGKVVAKMVPSSMLYRSLVDPLYFTFDKKTKKLISIKGRTLPKVKVDGKWKDFNALIVYK